MSLNLHVATPMWPTADFAYARFVGDREIERFDRVQKDRRQELEAWRGQFTTAFEDVDPRFLVANNHFAGHAPATARLVREVLGLPDVDLGAARRDRGQAALGDF